LFDKKVVRRIFGPKREDAEVSSRRLYGKGLHSLYKEDVMGGTYSTYGTDGKCIKILSENLKGRDRLEYVAADGKII
jgi:hypothetical protein